MFFKSSVTTVTTPNAPAYQGIDNLEVMQEAKNYNRFLMKTVLKYASFEKSIVDFGAGIGTFALQLKQLGYKITCVENDASLKNHLRKLNLDCMDKLGDIEDSSIDYIYTLNVLEHIDEDFETVAIFHKKIRPDGILLVYVPAFNMLYSGMDRKVGHLRRYRLGGLRKILENAGFKIIRNEYVDFIGFFAALGYLLTNHEKGNINLKALRFYDRFLFPASQFIDQFTHLFMGKNLLIVAQK
ncbi:MAG TPA: class I SAM-dependent methyltransferase [Candidatus Competibacteraceae bacterium]|nr:class I SAM-dependent methyltransferase [Candidatus Competibacteraceae bacterium]MCP5132584.1 class I SAM-dependent methyltransferase [Gammaproteobacteria bacterium]HPF57645.1 class I SAM-dependent methyltransferase [Candidatus Competibacteraceae bacterium]HRY16970.1 class I SAM-dependent methyltransferase [Candidatus Competibacteraceae bacterium]